MMNKAKMAYAPQSAQNSVPGPPTPANTTEHLQFMHTLADLIGTTEERLAMIGERLQPFRTQQAAAPDKAEHSRIPNPTSEATSMIGEVCHRIERLNARLYDIQSSLVI